MNLNIEAWNEAAFIPSFYEVGITISVVSAFFIPLEAWFPASASKPRSDHNQFLSIVYWFFTPLFTRILTNAALFALLLILFFLLGRTLDASVFHGFGPLSQQPLILQSIEVILLADLIEYWTHRLFHGRQLWKFHAIHHSPTVMNWLSSARMHPVNDLITRVCQVIPLIAVGFSIHGVVQIIPYLFFYVVFIHSNLKWDFGVFRYVLVSPAYHRWHHTSDHEAIDKNFAGIFPIWDIIFGTCHFPKRSPKEFGVTHDAPPESFFGQLMYPFHRTQSPTIERGSF